MIVNLGCGYKTTPHTVDIDFAIQHRLRATHIGRAAAKVLLHGERKRQFEAMGRDVLLHDLRKGIPFEDQTVDAVYHSHVLEHIDREAVPGFFGEIRRVLRPGGIHRIVVPDLEGLARNYLASLEREASDHAETAVSPMIDQMVRREAHGTSLQRPLRRWVENRVLGDARRRGETHQWMYDHLSLEHALLAAGFSDVRRVDAATSGITGWNDLGLDLNEARSGPHKPGSLYMECKKP